MKDKYRILINRNQIANIILQSSFSGENGEMEKTFIRED
jgi:hypothetical protein